MAGGFRRSVNRPLWMCGAALLAMSAGVARADPTTTQVQEVVVTGVPYGVSLDSATTSVDVVTSSELQAAPAVGLGDLLATLPGVRSTSYGPGASRPVIRGLSGPRVLLLENGTGLVDASALSPDHAVPTDPGEASRIEVLRGPASLAYGGSAIGGVVNVIDDRVPSATVRGIEGRLSGSDQDGNDGRALSGAFKAGAGDLVFAVDGAWRRSGDYEVPVAPVSRRLAAANGLIPLNDRRVENSFVDLNAYGAGVSYVGDNGHLGVSVRRTETQYGIPFLQVANPDPGAEGPVFIDLHQTRYDLRGERAFSDGPFERVRAAIGYADYEHSEVDLATGDIGTRFLSHGAEGRLELVQRDQNGWQGAIGVQGLSRRFSAIGDEAFVPQTDIEEAAVFVLQRLDRGGWGLEGGARLDTRRLSAGLAGRPTSDAAQSFGLNWSATPADRQFTNLSASGAVFGRPAEGLFVSVSLSYNRRAPTEFELFADGPHPGTGGYEIGDPSLGAEAVVTAEGTVRLTRERFRGEAHLFAARYDGFIEEAPTGLFVGDDGVPDPGGELPVFRYFATDATFYGGELAGDFELARWSNAALHLTGQADFVHGDTDAGPPARIPPWSVTGGLELTSARYDLSAEVRHVAEQNRVAAFELPTAGYTLFNARATWRPFADERVSVFVDGRNLGNVEAREHVSFLKDVAPLPGRSLRIGFASRF